MGKYLTGSVSSSKSVRSSKRHFSNQTFGQGLMCVARGGGRRSGVQGYPWLFRETDASLGYLRSCLQKTEKIKLNF